MQHDWRHPGNQPSNHAGSKPHRLSSAEQCIEAFDAELDYLFASLRRLGGRPWELEDLAHQVFLVSLHTWQPFVDQRAVRLHLFSLAVRVMARHRRRIELALNDGSESLPLILTALDQLPLARRAVLVLHDLDGMPANEIAAGLSMTRAGVAVRLRRARRELVIAIRRLALDRQASPFGCLDLLLAARGMRAQELLEASGGRAPDADDDETAGEVLQLQDEVLLLETLMDDLPDAIYFKDRESRFTRINRYAAAHYGIVNPALAVGRTDFDFFTEEHAGQALRDEQHIMRTGQPLVSIEEKETLPDGKLRWVSTTKLPLRDRDGDIVGILGLSHDITQRKQVA